MTHKHKAAALGVPSLTWQFGQERRLQLIQKHAPFTGKTVLDIGCGIGTYVGRMREFASYVAGIDGDYEYLSQGAQALSDLALSTTEALPFPDNAFDVALMHEVLEHVTDDQQSIHEAWRVLNVGGWLVLFVPNRLYPFETHGHYWKGTYHFGNTPLINYLPDPLRDRLAPHVRAYTTTDLRRLFSNLHHRVVIHTQIFPGYDKIVRRRPNLARLFRKVTYLMEATPIRTFGISHFLVLEKLSPKLLT